MLAEEKKKVPCGIGLLAHVDAGKTTLSEAMLFSSGARRTLGRVDRRDTLLDSDAQERERGITIYAKQARFSTESLDVTLVDTPGHVDFSSEAERVMPVLDCAVLVVSGAEGVQAHTVTLWNLLKRYRVPVFLFVNKMDLAQERREALMEALQTHLDPGCVDFGQPMDALSEAAALCDEALLETYLQTGQVTQGNLRGLIAGRRIFPCRFGSALKLEGVAELLKDLEAYAPRPSRGEALGAQVYKITYDPQGVRLTWLKLTGGTLRVRDSLAYRTRQGEPLTEKITQLRLYSGDRFTAPEAVEAGTLCAAVGLTATWAGQGLGAASDALPPVTEPVMTYRLQTGVDPALVMPKLKTLEEDPQLRILFDPATRQIRVQVMGRVQREVLLRTLKERFGLDASLDSGRVYYKETIAAPVEGVGHYEPLRHYAEVHLLLEPLPRGAGLVFDTACSTDVLDGNYQRLILTHLREKTHLGVLTGGPITDMKLTLLIGKAHLKHTEGGDFRQATYRAVRQGLMKAESVLLEPWYDFVLTLPAPQLGRAITDLRAMGGTIEPPETIGQEALLRGRVPAGEVGDYPDRLAAYTQGRGRLQLTPGGYDLCHNAQAVIEAAAYDPQADLDNSPDSIFCAHGAGFVVKWDQVPEYMHLDSGYGKSRSPGILTKNLAADDKALEAIMEREFGPIKRPAYRASDTRPATEEVVIRAPRDRCLIVDGYNVLFQWESLRPIAQEDLETARRRLMDALSSYAGFRKLRLVLVFDGYKVKGNPGEKERYHNIQVVYTKENETADAYIEALAAQLGGSYAVSVATSDALVQLSSLRAGVLRKSARELEAEVEEAHREMEKHFKK